MAICPFAEQDPLVSGGNTFHGGTYVGGPFKIVHHTTEGGDFAGARATYLQTTNYPHFTVTDTKIYQHLDTDRSATALKHPTGTVETNRSCAVQMEVVGFEAHPKSAATLANIARLCRWIEATHQVAREWPSGFPAPPASPINRNANTWLHRSGHYGHCHVPANDHEDPGYTVAEVRTIMGQTDVAISVGTHPVPNAHGAMDGDVLWAAVRPVIEAMGGTVEANPDGVTVTSHFKGETIVSPARGIASGTALIALRELRRFPGVQVNFTPGNPPKATIVI